MVLKNRPVSGISTRQSFPPFTPDFLRSGDLTTQPIQGVGHVRGGIRIIDGNDIPQRVGAVGRCDPTSPLTGLELAARGVGVVGPETIGIDLVRQEATVTVVFPSSRRSAR